jgi:ankyrin repeat protein
MHSKYRELPILNIARYTTSGTTLKECNELETFKSLLDASNDLNEFDISLMLNWAFNCRTSGLIRAITDNNMNSGPFRNVVVHDADEDVIKLLAEKIGVNFKFDKDVEDDTPNYRGTSEEGDTILMWAVRKGLKEVVEFLLNRGAEVNLKNNNGKTPLMVSYENLEITRLLIAYGAKVNEQDNQGMSALMWIIVKRQPNINIIKFLLSKSADVNLKNQAGWTALMLAAAKLEEIGIFELLVNSGARVQEKSHNNSNALMCLANAGAREGFHFLISPNLSFDDPASHSIWYRQLEIDKMDESNNRNLSNSIEQIILFLLKNGLDINSQNDEGWTALMFAVLNANQKILVTLFLNRADTDLVNKQGNSTLDIALSYKDKLQKKLSPHEFENLMLSLGYSTRPYLSATPQFPTSPQIPRNFRGGRNYPRGFHTTSSSFYTNNPPHIQSSVYSHPARGGRGGNIRTPSPSSQSFFANPPLSLQMFSNNLDEIGKKILKIAENKPPYWEVLSQRLGLSDKESRKELGSLQMELRRELNSLLSEQNANLLDAIKSAKARGLISKETSAIFKNINEAANQAKHENDNFSPAPSGSPPPSML